jgi:two-component system response regulator RegX3
MERLHTESSGLSILVVEDEDAILRGLCDVLAFQGYSPTGVVRGDTALEMALDVNSDLALVLLDVMLPGLSGFDVCEQIRAQHPTLPILMLTARGSEEDVLRGFRCGADDYVTKPFSVAELVARVDALLRRRGREANESQNDSAHNSNKDTVITGEQALSNLAPFEFGGWRILPEARSASRGDGEIELTARDLEILSFGVRESGRILSRRLLLAEIWGYPDPERVETRSVDMHIAKLRKKLGPEAGALIETVRGEGYRFRG